MNAAAASTAIPIGESAANRRLIGGSCDGDGGGLADAQSANPPLPKAADWIRVDWKRPIPWPTGTQSAAMRRMIHRGLNR